MASRILAQLLVAGGTAVARAAVQAWQQALVNAQRSGVTSESIKAAARTGVTSQEARMILGVDNKAKYPEIRKQYEHLMEANEKHGSFYLVSKVYRAKEKLDEEYKNLDDGHEKPK